MARSLVPYAFCFEPTDQQIISFFLYKMAVKRQLLPPPHDEYVHEEDLFDFKEPWEIWEEYGGDQDLYFFCQLKKTGLRIHRKIGEGTWSEKEHELVYNENGNPIWVEEKVPVRESKVGDHGGWILDEYSLLVGADERCFAAEISAVKYIPVLTAVLKRPQRNATIFLL